MTRIRTAIIPAAGLGTRMRPASGAVPKELLPVGGRPAIDWVLQEAVNAGISRAVVVSSPDKPSLDAYLADRSPERWRVGIEVVHQRSPRGLGDAIATGWEAAAGEPVAVLLPDELMLGGSILLASMIEHLERGGTSVLSITRVPLDEVAAYGCVGLDGQGPHGTWAVTRCVEKPSPDTAPSDRAIVGRYVLGTAVHAALERGRPGHHGEHQLTPALDRVARQGGVMALEVLDSDGRVDVGNWTGWWEANREAFAADVLFGPSAHSPVAA